MIDRNQLIKVIKEGNDNIDQRLILRKNGCFELVPYDILEEVEIFDQLVYVTRWSTFDRNKGFVGVDAANDERHIKDILDWADVAWERYEKTGRIKITNPNG